jgi:hypothetical protein
MPLRELVPENGTVCPVGQEKKTMVFSSLAGGKTGIFSKIADWVWGRDAPTSAREQSAQFASLYYVAKLASSKVARIQEGQN